MHSGFVLSGLCFGPAGGEAGLGEPVLAGPWVLKAPVLLRVSLRGVGVPQRSLRVCRAEMKAWACTAAVCHSRISSARQSVALSTCLVFASSYLHVFYLYPLKSQGFVSSQPFPKAAMIE